MSEESELEDFYAAENTRLARSSSNTLTQVEGLDAALQRIQQLEVQLNHFESGIVKRLDAALRRIEALELEVAKYIKRERCPHDGERAVNPHYPNVHTCVACGQTILVREQLLSPCGTVGVIEVP